MLKRQKGQGLVEFALIAPVLLLTILAIIETALIFQGYLTVQHAAREAARWAVTYKPEKGLTLDGELCLGVDVNGCEANETDQEYYARRVELIKLVAVEKAVGLRIDDTHLGLTGPDFNDFASFPHFYGVEVWGFPSFEEPDGGWTEDQLIDHPGLPGLPVRVRVTHNVELLDPLFQSIVPRVRVVAQAEMINEGTQAGYGNVAPPALPPGGALPSPAWEIEITDTPTPEGGVPVTPEGTPTSTSTATPTVTPTPEETPTATPTGPFIALSDYQVRPGQVILIDVNQHSPGTHPLSWVDDNLDFVEWISQTLEVDATGFRLGVPYTIPNDALEAIYYVESDEATSAPVEVLPPAPDLVVRSIGFAEELPPNEEITVTVEVENLSAGPVSGYFDVDLYVDPANPPVTNRPGTSKQWLQGIGANETKIVTQVVTLYGGGLHELWAQVDTSDWVPDEANEKNNILGPLAVVATVNECEDADGRILTDRFRGRGPEPNSKWSSALIGDATVHQMTVNEANATLSIEANGTGMWDRPDDGGTFMYQAATGDFVATLKIIQTMSGSGEQWAKIGLMARSSASASSQWISVMKARDVVQFGFRTGSNGERFASDVPAGAPVWVRLVRSGDTFMGYYSTDGATWIAGTGEGENGAVTVDLADTILIGIGATSYSGTPATAVVDDFEVCFLSVASETCQAYSDDFEPDSITAWSDVDIGTTLAGSSSKGGGTMTVFGDGASLWASDNLHYTYQQVSGDFVATIQINSGPNQAEWSKAGLMVRGSAAQDSAQVMVVKTRDHGLQFGYRPTNGDVTVRFADDNEDDTLPVWVRIIRSGNAFSALYSTDGANWIHAGSVTASVPESVMIGMAVSAYSGSVLGSANFDDFLFCAGEAGGITPPIIPPEEKPPGLEVCVQTIELGNFEASSITPPWYRNVDAYHASDETHSGNFSLEFRASVGPRPEYKHLNPWAYQPIDVPGDVLVDTRGILNYWQLVVPDPATEAGDPDDHFYLAIRNSAGVTLTSEIPLAHGNTDTPVFQQNVVSVETYLTGDRFAQFAGDEIQLRFYGVHDGETPGTSFYIDDVRFDICTIQPIPDDEPGTASFGGLVEVVLDARPTKMSGIQVWAYAPGGELYTTKTIHDSTYHFYNVPPGTYTVYAEVWIENALYTATAEVEVVSDERNYGVNLLLQ